MQKANAAEVCPEGKLSVLCRSTPSTMGKLMPNWGNTTDGRGARIMCLSGVVIRVANSCAKSIIVVKRQRKDSIIPATMNGIQPPI